MCNTDNKQNTETRSDRVGVILHRDLNEGYSGKGTFEQRSE